MAFGLARCLRTVVANDAVACDGERDLRMIHSLGWIPAHYRVAGITGLAGCWVRGSLALGNAAVVAADAATLYLRVIEVNIGTERNRVVAGRAVVGRLDVRRNLRRCIKHRSGDVANAAIARRTLEHRVQVARLAWQVAMHAIELEATGHVVEGQGNRRSLSCERSYQTGDDERCKPGDAAQWRHGVLLNPRAFP